MVNGEAVVAQVHQGTWPQSWLVLRAKASHFIRLAIFIAIFFVAAAFGLIYLVSHQGEVFRLGAAGSTDGGPLDPTTFSLWRFVDFSVLGILLVSLSVFLVVTLVQASRANEQLLILFPEGFVLNTGRMQEFAFATLQTLSATSYRGVVTLKMVTVDGQQLTVRLDARFGSARRVVQHILAARNQFVTSGLSTSRGPSI